MLGPGLERLHRVRRHRLTPLRYAAFRRALAGRVLSSAGSWMQITAAGWLVYELTESATAVGVLTMLNRGPGLLSAYSGVLVDRYEVRRLSMVLFGAQVIPAAALAVIAWDNLAALPLIYVLVFLSGAGNALSQATLPTLIPETVPPEEHAAANGLSGVGYSLAAVLGPLIGGGLVSAVGAGACFGVNALSYLALVALMPTLPPVRRVPEQVAAGLRPALTAAGRGTSLFALLVGAAVFALLVGPVQELAPVIARRHSDGAHVLGYLLAALAAGGVLGNLLVGFDEVPSASRRRLMGGAAILFAVATAGLAISPTLPLTLLAMLGTGMIWQASFVQLMTWLQTVAPASLSGRMVGFFFTVNLVGFALGALLVGLLFDAIGVTDGLLICAAGLAIWGLYKLLVPRRATPPPFIEPAGSGA